MKKLILALLLATAAIVYANVTIPYTYLPNTTIQSAQENANNQALQNEINTHEGKTTNVHGIGASGVMDLGTNQTATGIKSFSNGLKTDKIGVKTSPLTVNGHTIPNVPDDTFALVGASQSLTHKTIDGSFNTLINIPMTSFAPGSIGDTNVASNAAIQWTKISKVGSSVADLMTRSHLDLTGIGTNSHIQIDSHISNTSNPHSVTKAQAGLGNVTDDLQVKASDLDTDANLTADSDSKVATQKATKAYVGTQVGTREPTLTKGNLTAGSTKVAVVGGTNAVIGSGATVDVTEANIDHTHLANIGTNSHAQLDSHVAATNGYHGLNYSSAQIDHSVLVSHTQNTDVGTTRNDFKIGDGNPSNSKYLYANKSGTNDPFLAYDVLATNWVYSNDGTTTATIGSGGSGGLTKYGLIVDLPGGCLHGDAAIVLENNTLYECNLSGAAWDKMGSTNSALTASGVLKITANNLTIDPVSSTTDGYFASSNFVHISQAATAATDGYMASNDFSHIGQAASDITDGYMSSNTFYNVGNPVSATRDGYFSSNIFPHIAQNVSATTDGFFASNDFIHISQAASATSDGYMASSAFSHIGQAASALTDGYMSSTAFSHIGQAASDISDGYMASSTFYNVGNPVSATRDGYFSSNIYPHIAQAATALLDGYMSTNAQSFAGTKSFSTIDTANATVGGIDLTNLTADAQYPTGWVGTLPSTGCLPTYSWGSPTITFSAAGSVGTPCVFRIKGARFSYTTAQTTTINPSKSGTIYLYFNTAGALTASETTFPDMYLNTLLSYGYWSNVSHAFLAANGGNTLLEERHNANMPRSVHSYLHNTVGTRWASGLQVTGTVNAGTPASDANSTLLVPTGDIYDEDIKITVTSSGNSAPAARFEQRLGTSAAAVATASWLPVYYQTGDTTGATYTWVKTTADGFGFEHQGGNTAPDVNLLTGTTWSRNTVTLNGTGRFFGYWAYATNSPSEPVILMMDQCTNTATNTATSCEFTTLVSAQTNITPTRLNIGNLPFTEMKLLGRVIYQARSTYTSATHRTSINEIVDYRNSVSLPPSVSGGADHQSLVNRNASNAHPATSVATDTTQFDMKLTTSDTDVQKALDVLDNLQDGNYYSYGEFSRGATDIAQITASNATAALNSTLANVWHGAGSLSCLATAQNGYCETSLVTIPQGVNNCNASWYYKTAGTKMIAQVIDGLGATVADSTNGTTNLLPSATTFKNSQISFACSDASATNSYKLRFKDTDTSFSTNFIDGVTIGKNLSIGTGAIIGEWTSFTPTGSWTSNVAYTGKYRRVGDTMEAQVSIAISGAVTATPLTINNPSGLTINTSALANSTSVRSNLGNAVLTDNTGNYYDGSAVYNDTTSILMKYKLAPAADGDAVNLTSVTNATPVTWSASDTIVVNYKVPIKEWSGSGTTYTADAAITPEAIYQAGPVSCISGSFNVLTCIASYPIKIKDTHNAYNTSTGEYTIPSAGSYKIDLSYVSASSNNGYLQANVIKNGSVVYYLYSPRITGYAGLFSIPLIDCNVGDKITVQIGDSGSGSTPSGTQQYNIFSIFKASGSQVKMPQIVNSVTTPYNGVLNMVTAYVGTSVCSSTPCTIARQSGGIASITRGSTGAYDINFSVGTFSEAPSCSVVCHRPGVSNSIASGPTGSGATTIKWPVNCLDFTQTSIDAAIDIICVGKK